MSRICFKDDGKCGESWGISGFIKFVDLYSQYLSIFDWKYEGASDWLIFPRYWCTFSFVFSLREAANSPAHTGAIKALARRGVVTYEMSKWMERLYSCTVLVGTGEKRCLVEDGVEMGKMKNKLLVPRPSP